MTDYESSSFFLLTKSNVCPQEHYRLSHGPRKIYKQNNSSSKKLNIYLEKQPRQIQTDIGLTEFKSRNTVKYRHIYNKCTSKHIHHSTWDICVLVSWGIIDENPIPIFALYIYYWPTMGKYIQLSFPMTAWTSKIRDGNLPNFLADSD